MGGPLAACGQHDAGVRQGALFLGERRIQVQHERVGVGTEFGDDERHSLRHQAGDERHVTAQPVELRHQHRALLLSRIGQRRSQLAAALQRIGALTGFDLDNSPTTFDALGFSEALDGSSSYACSPRPWGHSSRLCRGSGWEGQR